MRRDRTTIVDGVYHRDDGRGAPSVHDESGSRRGKKKSSGEGGAGLVLMGLLLVLSLEGANIWNWFLGLVGLGG